MVTGDHIIFISNVNQIDAQYKMVYSLFARIALKHIENKYN